MTLLLQSNMRRTRLSGLLPAFRTHPAGQRPQASARNGTGSAADLFRYSAPGTRSFLGTNANQALGSLAYFSINSGTTNIVPYNNTNNDDDYGDFSTSCLYVQDATGCPGQVGLTIDNDSGVELKLLDSVGYTLTTLGKQEVGELAPEPSSVVMVVAGMGAIGFFARRRRARVNG